uniref:Uncharacterized protein n=1 Tax=Lepeophtheirus salmonis TaxID=72036 RepID=A0A0K2UCG6_LEPSM
MWPTVHSLIQTLVLLLPDLQP